MSVPQQDVDQDLVETLKFPHGRVKLQVATRHPDSTETREMCIFDFDMHDSVDLIFTTGEGQSEVYTFALTPETHRKNEMSRKDAARRQQQHEMLERRLGEELRAHDITAEDYYEDSSIRFEELSSAEQQRVLELDLSDIISDFEELQKKLSKRSSLSFLSKIFKRK